MRRKRYGKRLATNEVNLISSMRTLDVALSKLAIDTARIGTEINNTSNE